MCEFNVILDGKIQFKEAIYVKQDGPNVITRDVMGSTQEFKNCKIQEVDVPHARLVLVPA
jgi:predicted RNA-binding protein